MFYERFERLCKQHGTSPFGFCKQIGLSGGVAAYWKESGKPPKRETLERIAQEFDVSVDYLLGRETEKPLKQNFYDIFKQACNELGTTPSAVCADLGFSNSLATYWKKSGGTPKREALEKIAHYLGVSVDFLLGREKTASVITDRSGMSDLLMRLSVEELQEVRDFALYLLSRRQDQSPQTD